MPTLSQYITETQQLIHDQSFQTVSSTDMTSYINRARRRTAEDTQCVRLLLSGQGPVLAAAVVSGGSGYTAPVVTITGQMGTGCVATATLSAGVVTAINILNGGSNYSPPLLVTITDPTGHGAAATASQAANLLTTVVGQEIYTYAAANSLLAATPGYASILDVINVAATWGGMKPQLGQVSFGVIQAYYRSYAVPTTGQAYIWAKYGQGIAGSIYLWQIPSTAQAMDWDCVCLPIDLVDDTTVDAIPQPFSEAVAYYAARLCYLNAQRYSDADLMKEEYKMRATDARTATSGPMVPDWYNMDSW